MANSHGQVKLRVVYDERCAEYSSPGHPERPQRVLGTSELLRKQDRIPIEWLKPGLAEDGDLTLAHTSDHVDLVDNPPGDFDGDTAAHPGIGTHARRSAGAAILALKASIKAENKRAFSLMRPPGHHSTPSRAMGFCYFSNAAIISLKAQKLGFPKVAILDFDVHHGNGTEAVVINKPDILFTSTHQSPCYPGTGLKDEGNNCFNFPISPNIPADQYMKKIEAAVEKVKAFSPDLLVVSAGFDAYKNDPIANELLDVSDFRKVGKMVSEFSVPVVSILEGGYSDDLPELVLAYLEGWMSQDVW